MTEEWRPTGYPYYEASDLGRIRSLDRVVDTSTTRRSYKGKVLRQTGGPYLSVMLSDRGVQIRHSVHSLVVAAFLGTTEGLVIDHINGDPTDNRLVNLRQVTISDNLRNRNKAAGVAELVGVAYRERNKARKFEATATGANGKQVFLGRHETAEQAHEAWSKYRDKMYSHHVR